RRRPCSSWSTRRTSCRACPCSCRSSLRTRSASKAATRAQRCGLRLSRSERMSETRKAASLESARRPPATGSGEAQRYRTLRALVEVSAVEAGSVVYCCTLVYARSHEGHVLDCGRGGCARAVPSTHDPAMDLEP